MKRQSVLGIFIFLLFSSDGFSQEIQLHFPHFTGQNYEWKIFQGKQELTIRSGEIPSDGRVTLTMPETYQDYQGMGLPRHDPMAAQKRWRSGYDLYRQGIFRGMPGRTA